ncbi:MAG: hypothetical protein QOD85_1861, partial [Gaiellaceae bacterium]|nr:hypothetical protein [Gaiellaceae bacterium]
ALETRDVRGRELQRRGRRVDDSRDTEHDAVDSLDRKPGRCDQRVAHGRPAGQQSERVDAVRRGGIRRPVADETHDRGSALHDRPRHDLELRTLGEQAEESRGLLSNLVEEELARVMRTRVACGGLDQPCSRSPLHRGNHGAAGEVDWALAGMAEDVDPSADGVAALATRLADGSAGATSLSPPYDTRAIFAAARRGDALGRRVVEEVARRIAAHITPIAAVADPALIVLGGGLGANGDLLLTPVRRLLAAWLPYPPRVEISSLGEAAVLMGALAVGLRSALDNVFVNRARPARS